MNLDEFIRFANVPPVPWAEGRTIPWDDLGFSSRMLVEHLSQAHDGASRRDELIDQHVAFIESHVLTEMPARILDLGCGPGLYANKLASKGHNVLGIDFGPASIDYARAHVTPGAPLGYELGDIRNVDFGTGNDLVMLLYGELNLFPRDEAVRLLRRCADALTANGRVLMEVHSADFIRKRATAMPRWQAAISGLFSDRPHLRLDQAFWLEDQGMAAGRHWIVDAATNEVSLYGWCMQAYSDESYEALFAESGLGIVSRHANLRGLTEDEGFPVLVARRV